MTLKGIFNIKNFKNLTKILTQLNLTFISATVSPFYRNLEFLNSKSNSNQKLVWHYFNGEKN